MFFTFLENMLQMPSIKQFKNHDQKSRLKLKYIWKRLLERLSTFLVLCVLQLQVFVKHSPPDKTSHGLSCSDLGE